MDVETFEAERSRLFGIAYRMLGSAADAEDIVQDAWIRCRAVDTADIERPPAYLTTITTRLAIDRLRSAQSRRETYVGPWLPEPIVTADDPADMAALGDSVTFGFLSVLDRLSPVDRAVFLLREVFDMPYPEVAAVVDRSETACRQIASRARSRVRAERPSVSIDADRRSELLGAFLGAVASGDIDQLEQLLTDDIVLVSDGGPNARAARRPVVTPPRVARLMSNLYRRAGASVDLELIEANGQPALYVSAGNEPVLLLTIDPDSTGERVQRVWVVVSPEKLAGVAERLGERR
ncbi:MAG: RNA polymerase sigma-70 factor [Acidimicrobiia bacterium]|nr:RNA polymerase sigma-70 factor [Acidimicrobiia bacterium]